MMWRVLHWSAPGLLFVALSGCQAPGAFNFPPYNATQVAPPGTGSYGRTAPGVSQMPVGDAYYSRQSAAIASPAGQNAAVASAGPSSVGDWRAATSASLVDRASASSPGAATGQGQVIPASAIAPIDFTTGRSTAGKETVRIVEPAGAQFAATTQPSGQPPATAGGMPVNDGTRLREPRFFSPPPGVIAISQWPAAAAGANLATGGSIADTGNPARSMRGLPGSYAVAQVSAEAPASLSPATSGLATGPAAFSTMPTAPTSSSPAASTASAAPLGWRVKDGLK